MGKNQHSKDKLYVVASEYARDWGGYKKKKLTLPFRALPFDCCALTLLPFNDAVCTSEGLVFDAESILAYIKRFKRNPVTGDPLTADQLIPLHWHKNAEGRYFCPVTFKEFNAHSFIVANRKSGHVYSNDAIENLCRKSRLWEDFITGEKFSPSDIVIIQNPHNVDKRKLEDFEHLKNGVDVPQLRRSFEGTEAKPGSLEPHTNYTPLMQSIMKETKESEGDLKAKHHALSLAGAAGSLNEESGRANSEQKVVRKGENRRNVEETEEVVNEELRRQSERSSERKEPPSQKGSEEDTKHYLYSTHRLAASFTSTIMDPTYEMEYRAKTELERRQPVYDWIKKRKAKGYVRLQTTLGMLNFEIHADLVPLASDNFIRHCSSDYYVNTIFHRSIPGFMIQGGDPSGTGSGGVSAFEGGKPFVDEPHPKLLHQGQGVLSMANAGRNSNKSQFFITYRSAEHLNGKHSVFGKLVGGLDTLRKMEQLPTNSKTERPKDPPKITHVIVFKNPFEEAEKELQKQKDQDASKSQKAVADASVPWFSNMRNIQQPKHSYSSLKQCPVGLYMSDSSTSSKKRKRNVSNDADTNSTFEDF